MNRDEDTRVPQPRGAAAALPSIAANNDGNIICCCICSL
jgi:hypothetical protein